MQLPLPERGQPLDVAYLYDIAKQVNQNTKDISSSGTTSVIDNGINVPESILTNNIRIYATTEDIQTGSVTAGSSQEWSANFTSGFLYVPVVTATVKNNSGSEAGNNIFLSLKNIATGSVSGNLLYNSKGSIDITINIIAIGISR